MGKKLFELIVVEQQLKAQATAVRGELGNTFEKKRHLFESKHKTFRPAGEGQALIEEQSDIQSTVKDELKWFAGIVSKALDTSYAVAYGDTFAKADVVLDDNTVVLRDVPGLALLELEKRLGEYRELFLRIPTLDPAKGFTPDPTHAKGSGVFKARERTVIRTKKVEEHVVVVPPTDRHPAHVVKESKDVVAGHVTELEWSGLITPLKKAELVDRTETLQRAVKAALQRANAVELDSQLPTCSKAVFDFLLNGL